MLELKELLGLQGIQVLKQAIERVQEEEGDQWEEVMEDLTTKIATKVGELKDSKGQEIKGFHAVALYAYLFCDCANRVIMGPGVVLPFRKEGDGDGNPNKGNGKE